MKITIEGPQGCGKTIIAGIIGNVLENLGCQNLLITDDNEKAIPAACSLSEDDLIRIFSSQDVWVKIVDTFSDEKINSSHQLAECATQAETATTETPSEASGGRELDTNQFQNNSSEETRRTAGSSNCRLGRPEDLHADNTSS